MTTEIVVQQETPVSDVIFIARLVILPRVERRTLAGANIYYRKIFICLFDLTFLFNILFTTLFAFFLISEI